MFRLRHPRHLWHPLGTLGTPWHLVAILHRVRRGGQQKGWRLWQDWPSYDIGGTCDGPGPWSQSPFALVCTRVGSGRARCGRRRAGIRPARRGGPLRHRRGGRPRRPRPARSLRSGGGAGLAPRSVRLADQSLRAIRSARDAGVARRRPQRAGERSQFRHRRARCLDPARPRQHRRTHPRRPFSSHGTNHVCLRRASPAASGRATTTA